MDFRDPSSIPLPTTDDEFERLCLLIARDRYGPEFYRYGRRGQAQHGIDIYSAYHKGRCLQCKLHKKDIHDNKLIEELEADLQAAKQKFTDLKQFIFAISLETRPKIQDACKDLSDDNIQVIPWFWNQLQEDIARSHWLLRYYLNYEVGAQWVSDDFLDQELKKGEDAEWQLLQYYSSNNHVQWYGLLRHWDAPRQHYANICQAIAESFADTYSDMPVAAVVRGAGGSGKSVLLRRLSVDLRNAYSVYWIADNAEAFLENEWLYDIDNNPTEKYLLILEDWYRNFSDTNDRVTANRLLQKVKGNSNVRLVIGDRHSQNTYYPKTDRIIFNLKNEENGALLSHVINIIPAWRDKFAAEQRVSLLKTGLFQVLFVYQYADTNKTLEKAEEYFMEIIQSDYRRLVNSDILFYRGLAHALYVYAHLYTNFSIYLSPDALIKLAETYSGSQRPFELKQHGLIIGVEAVVKRYLDIDERGKFRFLHDTLADEGWKFVQVDNRKTFGSSASILEIAEAFKSEVTKDDLSLLAYRTLKLNRSFFTKAQLIPLCDYLLEVQCKSRLFTRMLFDDRLLEITDEERLCYLWRLVGVGNRQHRMWLPITTWVKNKLAKDKQLDILRHLVDAGNVCPSVLINYYQLLDERELKKRTSIDFTIERLIDPDYARPLSVYLNRIGHNPEIQSTVRHYLKTEGAANSIYIFIECLKLLKMEDVALAAARNYLLRSGLERNRSTSTAFVTCLQLLKFEKVAKDAARKYLRSPAPEEIPANFVTCLKLLKDKEVAKDAAREYLKSLAPEKIPDNFSTCLKLLKDEDVAKDAARKYLKSLAPEKIQENFVTCLKLLKDEDVAKEKARKYLQSSKPEKITENFTTCLKLLKDEDVAKEKAREYLWSAEPEKIPVNFSACLNMLGEEASDIAAYILESPIEGQDQRVIYCALTLAAETDKLNIVAENMVNRILAINKADRAQFYLYLQMMKVPLFRINLWQREATRLLQCGFNIHRNLFYSLTISHINDPDPLANACLYFVRNWKHEFKQPKKYWTYFIRSLAHPIIEEQPAIQDELRGLCRQMLLADNCPSNLQVCLKSITDENKFPEWKRAEDDEL